MGYTEVFPPFMVNRDFHDAAPASFPSSRRTPSRVANNDYFLIPTAEVPVTNMHRGRDSRRRQRCPSNTAAYSACFRAEAGSAGRDTSAG